MPNRTELSDDHQPNGNDADQARNLTLVTSTESYATATVRISSLVLEDSPRLSGEDPDHTRLLAETEGDLPPITVHRPTMRVIDGAHRVQAALLRGNEVIEARLLDCDENTAFVLAVKANVTHGLPLSKPERKTAAARIIVSYPHWSDRAVAAATGLSDKTVSRVRARSTSEDPQSDSRIGQDGRQRPLSTEAKRRQAAAMIDERPDAGLREVARATGLSPATVRDVRQRMERDEDPVPPKYRPGPRPDALQIRRLRGSPRMRHPDLPPEPQTLLARLRNDPSLRFNEVGRRTLRWLHLHLVDTESWESEGLGVPEHCTPVVADLARSCALAWTNLADRLERQSQETGDSTSRRAN